MNKNKEKPSLESYAKYSSLAFQMIIIIVAGTFAGIKLDECLQLKFPIGKVVLPVLSIFFSLYIALKDLLKKK